LLCPKIMLIPLPEHCAKLTDVLVESTHYYEWEETAEWLLLAGSIKSVLVDIIQYDGGFGFCSDADEFTCSKEDLLERLVTDLTRFNYVWGAIESAINTIKPPKHPQKNKSGKIRDACYLLNNYFNNREPVLFLKESIDDFIGASQSCFGYEKVQSRYSEVNEFGVLAIGLYCVYELRNSFAHGSLSFPTPDEENRPISEHSSMVIAATRVALITLQMLLLAHYNESSDLITFQFSTEDDREEYPLWFVIRGCHLEIEENNGQLSLFQA
jgi:hypothetical protein